MYGSTLPLIVVFCFLKSKLLEINIHKISVHFISNNFIHYSHKKFILFLFFIIFTNLSEHNFLTLKKNLIHINVKFHLNGTILVYIQINFSFTSHSKYCET